MKQSRLGILALVILLVGAGWWWVARTPATASAALPVDQTPSASPSDAEVITPVEPVPRLDERASVAGAVAAEPATPEPSEPVVASPRAGISLSGRIVVVDPQGVEHRTEDGHLAFILWTGSHGNHHRVDVISGIWSTSIPEPAEIDGIQLAEVVLGERPAYGLDGEPPRMPAVDNLKLELRVQWPQDTLLHVRDRASGRELDHVMLIFEDHWSPGDFAHPGDVARSEKDFGSSPLHLPPREDGVGNGRVVYARSAGYAWGRLEFDNRRGGERFLPLDPGGELEIQLIGTAEDPNAKLRLYGTGGMPVVEFGLRNRDALKVSSLLPGEYRVSAQIGEWWDDEPVDLGEVPALIRANETTRVVLTLQVQAPPTRVPCAGSILVPPEWELGEFALEFELLGTALGGGDGRFRIKSSDMERRLERPYLFHWKAPEVQPGRYEVLLRDLAFSVGLDVPAQGLLDAIIEVPLPTSVEVRCLDDTTGVQLERAQVSWHFKKPEGVSGWSNEPAAWNAERHCYHFRAPIGSVEITADCENYASTSKAASLEAGSNRVEIRLRKRCGLKPILRDGTTTIPWESGASIGLVPAEGQQAEHSSYSMGGGVIVLFRVQPGLYTLKLPHIPGYLPVPDQIVRCETGVVIEHVVQLVREH